MTRPTYLLDVCWNDEDVLCLQNTASTPAQEQDLHRGKHVFDAIHTPPPLYHHADVRRFVASASRNERSSSGGRAPTDQDRMLAAIDEGRGAGRNLLFVAGATGAGKSHMVRWLHSHYSEQNPSALSIHLRRRDIDLVKVVRRLATAFGQQGAALSKLVADAEAAGAATTSTLLNATLVSALSAYAREVAENSIHHSSTALTPQQAALRRAAGFADVDHDPKPATLDLVTESPKLELTQYWAELIRTQPAEEALEEGLLTKMREADPEKRQVVGDDLLPLSTLADADLAPRLLFLRDRLADPTVRSWIAEALIGPKAMDFAVQASGASIQAELLQNALGDALEGAAEHGLRVVFFFEDWGSVTGVRSGLLEAFTSMDDTHTAVIADTTRELRKLQDNVADRSIAVFELGAVSDSFALQLAGRALNAVRVGGARLYQAREASAPLTNRCTDCAFVRDCHRTFGAVDEDELGPIGLFPLTPDVIERALARDGMEPTPRSMSMKILRKAIEHSQSAFRDSRYPTAEIVAALAPMERPLNDADELSEIGSVVGPDRTTTSANILHLYRQQRALRSLPHELAEAFDLNEFSSDATAAPSCARCSRVPCTCIPVGPSGEPPHRPRPVTAAAPSIPELAKDAEYFGRSEALRLGNKLRDLMFEYSIAGVGFGNGIATRTTFKNLRHLTEARFGLEGIQGAHVASATREDAASLRVLAWASTTDPPGSWREQDNGHRRRATALNRVATWTQDFEDEFLSPEPRRQRASILLPYLAAHNALVFPRTPVNGPAELLNLALSEAGPERPEALPRYLQHALDERALARQHLLADLAFVQGDSGAVFGIAANLIYDDLHTQYDKGLQLPDADRLPELLKRWGLAVARAVEEARAELRETLDSIDDETDPIPDDQLEGLRTAANAIRTTSADLPGRVATAESMAINRLLETIERASAVPEPSPFQAPEGLKLLPPLQLPGALQDAREFLARLKPRAEVTRAARSVISMLGRTYESTHRQVLSELNGLLHELQERTGALWPATEAGPFRRAAAAANRAESLVDELVDVERSLRSEGQRIEFEQRTEAASARANKILDLLERQELLQQQRKALGEKPTRRRGPPAPRTSDSISHLLSGAMTDWLEQTERQQWEQGAELQILWAQLKADRRPANHWQIARLLGDVAAEDAFEEAEQLHDALGTDVPLDAPERLAAVRDAERRAWESLRARRDGPALGLAIRIQESNGWLDLADIEASEIVPLLGPDGDRMLRFELRILEE